MNGNNSSHVNAVTVYRNIVIAGGEDVITNDIIISLIACVKEVSVQSQ